MQTKTQKILSLLKAGKPIKEIAQQAKVKPTYVYYVRWNDAKKKNKKATFKSPRSKIIQAVMQTKKGLGAIKSKTDLKDDWESKKDFWKTMRGQYGDATAELMDQLVDPKPIFGEITATPDPVNNPPHYKAGGIETLDFIEAKDLNFRLGNVIKYVSRAGKKVDSDPIQDLEKARFYLEREIEARKNA